MPHIQRIRRHKEPSREPSMVIGPYIPCAAIRSKYPPYKYISSIVNSSRIFLTAQWRQLALLNFEIAPEILLPFLPTGTALDLWNGHCIVSVVGFLFLDTRLLGFPVPFHRDFEEVNLRFYVKRYAGDEVRRGVAFIKEIAPRQAIVFVARKLYNENYTCLTMRHQHEVSPNSAALSYRWKLRGRWHELQAASTSAAALPEKNSEAEFITEHYWGYSCQRDGGCMEYRVEHPQWAVRMAETVSFNADIAALYGREFVPALTQAPRSSFIADGSSVSVFKGIRLPKN